MERLTFPHLCATLGAEREKRGELEREEGEEKDDSERGKKKGEPAKKRARKGNERSSFWSGKRCRQKKERPDWKKKKKKKTLQRVLKRRKFMSVPFFPKASDWHCKTSKHSWLPMVPRNYQTSPYCVPHFWFGTSGDNRWLGRCLDEPLSRGK